MSGEDELIKDVEEEVKKLLTKRRTAYIHGKSAPPLSIYYFRSLSEVREEDLITGLRSGAILVALKNESLNRAKRFLEDVSQVIKQAGGNIYLIKSPSILIIGELVRLEIRD